MTLLHRIIRPNHFLTTPRLLKEVLDARYLTRLDRYVSRGFRADLRKTFLLAYPPADRIRHFGRMSRDNYEQILHFQGLNKHAQRLSLSECGINTPRLPNMGQEVLQSDGSTRYVVRPLRHYGGRNFRITSSPTDYNPSREYISELYEKDREYRVIYSLGVPIITLRKKVPEGLTSDMPWNHTNGSWFQTINDVEGSRLAQRTSFFTDITNHPVVKHAHLIGVDVMTDRNGTYAVAEINFAPAITIENNLEKVREHVQAHYSS